MISAFKPFDYPSPRKDVLLVFGVLAAVLGLGICMIGLVVSNGTHDIENWKLLIPVGVVICVFGIGTSFLLKIFAVPLSIAAAGFGSMLIFGSVSEGPFPWTLINISFGLAGCLPALVITWSTFSALTQGPNKARHSSPDRYKSK